jgi:hypothetical protein
MKVGVRRKHDATFGAYPADFAADLPEKQAKFEAQAEELTAASVFGTPAGIPAWKTKPEPGGRRSLEAHGWVGLAVSRWFDAHHSSHTVGRSTCRRVQSYCI